MAESKIPIPEQAMTDAVETAEKRRPRWQEAGRALRHRNFQLFFSGQLISLIGTWMQTVAQSWLVYRLTGSGLQLGAVGFASQIPVFLVAPIGGIVADRTNRKHVVIGTQIASMLLAFVLAALTLTHAIDHRVWLIFVLAALLGVVNAFDIPGRQSFLVDMVGKEDLMNAIALNSSMFNGARVVGPAVAGVLVARLGEGWCFFANGVSYIAVIAGLVMMNVHAPARISTKTPPWEHIKEGFQFVNRTAPIRALVILLGLVSVSGMPYSVLMPIFADKILHGGGQGLASMIGSHDLGAVRLGILMGAAGVGALLGALTLAVRTGVKGLGNVGHRVLRGLWHQPDAVFVFEIVLAVGRAAVARGIFHHVADGFVEYADSGDGAGRAARANDGGVFHDVHGHGSGGSATGRSTVGPAGRADHSRHWRFRIGDGGVVVQRAVAEDSRGGAAIDSGATNGWRRASRRSFGAACRGVASSGSNSGTRSRRSRMCYGLFATVMAWPLGILDLKHCTLRPWSLPIPIRNLRGFDGGIAPSLFDPVAAHDHIAAHDHCT